MPRYIRKTKRQYTWREIYKILKTAYESFEVKDVTFREWRKMWLHEKRHGAFRPVEQMLADIELSKARQRTTGIKNGNYNVEIERVL